MLWTPSWKAATNWLSWQAQGRLWFLCTATCHYLQHWAKASFNPRKTWKYWGEDLLMQKIKALAAGCVQGNAGQLAHNKLMARYVMVLHCVSRPLQRMVVKKTFWGLEPTRINMSSHHPIRPLKNKLNKTPTMCTLQHVFSERKKLY